MKCNASSLTIGIALEILCSVVLVTPARAAERETVEFPAEDGLTITADVYLAHPEAGTPFLVLFHQAGWSRGEYRETAPRLNALGFNCMAVDQRSGEKSEGVKNETAQRAGEGGMDTTYVDALPDMMASLQYAREHYAEGKLIALGSSYSAALVLKIAGDYPDLLDGVLAFSPGEYFGRLGMGQTWIRDSAKNIECPVFITSGKKERGAWQGIFEKIAEDKRTFFLPSTKGNHGSRALWKQFSDSAAYWQAVELFLAPYRVGKTRATDAPVATSER